MVNEVKDTPYLFNLLPPYRESRIKVHFIHSIHRIHCMAPHEISSRLCITATSPVSPRGLIPSMQSTNQVEQLSHKQPRGPKEGF